MGDIIGYLDACDDVLVAIGQGELDPAEVTRLLQGPSDLPARLTAPASGLFLERVFYPDDDRGALPLVAAMPVRSYFPSR